MQHTLSGRSASTLLLSLPAEVSSEDALAQTSDLLRCATTSAYGGAEHLRGTQRDHAMSVVHLVEMAQAMVDGLLDRHLIHAAGQ